MRGMEVSLYRFLTSALDGGNWSAWCSGHLNTSETSDGTHGIGGWVGKGRRNGKHKKNKNIY
jgi:hypothetical protein